MSAMFAREDTRQKGAIEIQTAEGDRVSIRFRTREVVTLASMKSTGAAGTDSASQVTVISRGRLQVEVDGNLNDDELAAIGDLLDQVDALATRFFAGDVQAAFDAAAHLGFDAEQIAGFSVDLTYSRKLTAAIATTGSPAAGDSALAPPAEDAAPAQAGNATEPASTPTASPTDAAAAAPGAEPTGIRTRSSTSSTTSSPSWRPSPVRRSRSSR